MSQPPDVAFETEHHAGDIKQQNTVTKPRASQAHAKSGQAGSLAQHSDSVDPLEPNTVSETGVRTIKQPIPKLFHLGMIESESF